MEDRIRTCRECGVTSDKEQFKAGKNLCKPCGAKLHAIWCDENAEHLKEYRSTPDFKKKRAISVAKCNQKSPEAFLRAQMQHLTKKSNYKKKTAKKLNPICLDVQIDYSYLIELYNKQNGNCALLEIPMTYQFKNFQSISVDRIDSTKGYIPGNVQLVCQFMNTAKKNYTNADCQRILDQYYETRKANGKA